MGRPKNFSKWVLMAVFALTMCLTASGFAITVAPHITLSGIVENISQDIKYIVVNKTKIFITPETKILDEKGSNLTKESLKLKDPVKVEAIQKHEGLFAQKLVVRKSP